MDTAKLLNVLCDIDNEEESESLSSLIQNLSSNISANQSNEISNNQQKIQTYFEKSRVNDYVPSDIEILQFIGADKYVGNSGLAAVQEILNRNSYNVAKTTKDLQDYVKERESFFKTIKETRNNLEKLNFEAYYPTNDNFQVGLLLPEQYTGNKIPIVTRELIKWDKLFKHLKELIGESPDDTEINFVSNGSLEFFIDNSPTIGIAIAYAVEKIVKIYKNIIEIRKTRDKLKELGIPPAEQKTLEKQEKELLSKELEKVSIDLIKEFASKKIEAGRLNELKIAMKGHITYMAKCVDNGIIIEVNPPQIEEPQETDENDPEEKKNENAKHKIDYDKTLKKVEIVQKSMDTLKTIGKFGLDFGKFLTNGELPEEAD